MFDVLNPEDFTDTELGSEVRSSHARGAWMVLLGSDPPLWEDDPKAELLAEAASLRREYEEYRAITRQLVETAETNMEVMHRTHTKLGDRLAELGEVEVLRDVQALLEEGLIR